MYCMASHKLVHMYHLWMYHLWISCLWNKLIFVLDCVVSRQWINHTFSLVQLCEIPCIPTGIRNNYYSSAIVLIFPLFLLFIGGFHVFWPFWKLIIGIKIFTLQVQLNDWQATPVKCLKMSDRCQQFKQWKYTSLSLFKKNTFIVKLPNRWIFSVIQCEYFQIWELLEYDTKVNPGKVLLLTGSLMPCSSLPKDWPSFQPIFASILWPLFLPEIAL